MGLRAPARARVGPEAARSARRPLRLCRRRARGAVRGADGRHGRARDSRRDRDCSGGLRGRPAVAQPARGLVGDRVGSGGIRRLRGADRPLGSGDVRRLHQARRRLDAHRARRSGHGARAQRGRPGVLDVLPRRRPAARRGVPARVAPAARYRARDRPQRRALALSAGDGRHGRHARARPLRAGRTRRRGPLAARDRGRRRCAVGAAVRVRALGRHQGDGHRVGAARPGRARAAGRQVGPVASADAAGRRLGAPARRAERRRARVARSCARCLPRPRRTRARPPRGRAADCGLCRLPRGLRAADARHRSRLPDVEHRQLRPDRESRRSAEPDPAGGHLARRATSAPIRSWALRRRC